MDKNNGSKRWKNCARKLNFNLIKVIWERPSLPIKGWFPYGRFDRHDRGKKRSAIVAIRWKPLFSNRSDHRQKSQGNQPIWKLLSDQSRNEHSTVLVGIQP